MWPRLLYYMTQEPIEILTAFPKIICCRLSNYLSTEKNSEEIEALLGITRAVFVKKGMFSVRAT